jgi:hypothetical protein
MPFCHFYQNDKNHLLKRPFFAAKFPNSLKKAQKKEDAKTQNALC